MAYSRRTLAATVGLGLVAGAILILGSTALWPRFLPTLLLFSAVLIHVLVTGRPALDGPGAPAGLPFPRFGLVHAGVHPRLRRRARIHRTCRVLSREEISC